jgi:hypothetical protein
MWRPNIWRLRVGSVIFVTNIALAKMPTMFIFTETIRVNNVYYYDVNNKY